MDVALTFDFDAEEVWVGEDPANAGRPGVLSQGTYGAKVAVPLILDLLDRHGLKPQFQRKKPRGKKMPAHIARGNASRARVRSRIEHVFAAQKCRLGLLVRTVGEVRARVKIGLANLAYNFTRLAWLNERAAPA
jgi:hypothetical protein